MNPPKDSGRTKLKASIFVLPESLGNAIGGFMAPMHVQSWRSRLLLKLRDRLCNLLLHLEQKVAGRRLLFLLLGLAAGCAAPRPGTITGTPPTFPPEAFLIQRATLSARGRQFTLNGYVARSERGGLRLIVTENFGNVLADLLVRPDGAATVIRSSGVLRPEWISNYMASDLKCVFGAAPDPGCVLAVAAPDHLIIERRWYRLDVRTVEIKPGPQPATLFEAVERGAP